MIETHAFGPWVPVSGAKFVILGSVSAKEAAAGTEPPQIDKVLTPRAGPEHR